jgi:flagellar hook-length control protein FliK
MGQSDSSALFSLAARPSNAKGLRTVANTKDSTKDRAEPFEPSPQDNDRPVRPRDDRRDVDRRDVDRRGVGRRDDVRPRESRTAEARKHAAPKAERKPEDAEPCTKLQAHDEPKLKETANDQPTDAMAKAEPDDEVRTCETAASSGEASDTPADGTIAPFVLATLFAGTDVAAAVPQDAVAPLQLVNAGAETDPEAETAQTSVQGSVEAGRARGIRRLVSGAVQAVIAAAERGAAKGEPATPASAEEAPLPEQPLGGQVSDGAKAAIATAGKGLALGAAAKLARAETPAREVAPDFQPTDFKLADAAAPHNLPNGGNAAQPGAASVRDVDAASGKERPSVVRDVPLGAVPIEIGVRAMAGVRRFEIRLDPADLGRIDVRLDMSDDGTVKAHLTVDKVETLALLQRDARTLERAFEQAGLKPSDGGIDLTLRDHSFAGHRQGGDGDQQRSSAHTSTFIPADQADEKPARLLWRGTTGLDVRV